jgi:hypothetical protein
VPPSLNSAAQLWVKPDWSNRPLLLDSRRKSGWARTYEMAISLRAFIDNKRLKALVYPSFVPSNLGTFLG